MRCFFFAIIGLFLGLLLTYTTIYLQNFFNLSLLLTLILNILLAISVLYIIETLISPNFSEKWQTTTPGLFFVALFFGPQLLSYYDVAAKIGI